MSSSISENIVLDPLLLEKAVTDMGAELFGRRAAQHMVAILQPERVLPPTLEKFKPLVATGMRCFLSHIATERIQHILYDTMQTFQSDGINQALLHLFLQLPTLHKLGQILARNPGIDPDLKNRLTQLECLTSTTKADSLQKTDKTLQAVLSENNYSLALEPLAEASVATVLLFTFKDRQQEKNGVLKILKSGIREKLDDELQAMEETGIFLEERRKNLALQEMQITSLFREIAENLREEIDLTAEQQKLIEASEIYSENDMLHIPELLPGCTASITAMEYLKGYKITDYAGPPAHRQEVARQLFEALICTPLFSLKNKALFHGDPHAGNIFALPRNFSQIPQIGLLDWTLAGHLSKQQRMTILQLMVGVETRDPDRILQAILQFLSRSANDERPGLRNKIVELTEQDTYQQADPLKRTFLTMEQLTLWGIIFPTELILYRKAFFTLEGVLHDISPGFSMSQCMEQYLGKIILEELPLRCWIGFSLWDKAIHYKSMLSNMDLFRLFSNRFFTLQQSSFFTSMAWLIQHPVK